MIWFSLRQIIPFYPLYQMVRVQQKYGIAKPSKWSLCFIWLTKLILLEPFRIIEASIMAILPEKEIRPIFILGYYRSGTTYLQELLSANQKHATLTLFQSVLPEISLCFSWLFKPPLSFFSKLFKVQNAYHRIPFDFDFPGEEDVAINSLMAYYDYNRIYQYPSKYDDITKNILTSPSQKTTRTWILNHRYLIKKLAYISGKRTIILKSPPNMARTPILSKAYPNASFVFIHRNPFECIQSTKRIWELNKSFSFEIYSDKKIIEIITKQYELFYSQYSDTIKPKVNCIVKFNDLVAQSEKTIERIYSELSLRNWEGSRIEIESIVKNRNKNKNKINHLNASKVDNFQQIKHINDELGYN